MIDPMLLSNIRAYALGAGRDDTRKSMADLWAHNESWHDAVVRYAKLDQCDIGAAAKGIIWLQEQRDGQRPV